MFSNRYSAFIFTISVLSLLACQGCLESADEVRKKVLAHDPSFRKVLNKKASLKRRIEKLRKEHQASQQVIDQQLAELQKKKEKASEEHALNVRDIRQDLEPHRRELEKSLLRYRHIYDVKKRKVSVLARDISEIDELLNKEQDLDMTASEVRNWRDKKRELVEKKQKASAELEKARTEIEMTRRKLKLLKL